MFIKSDITNPPVPYKALIDVANFAPAYYCHERHLEVAGHYKGYEYYEDDTSTINMYFSRKSPDLKLFKLHINWAEYITSRKVHITNIDHVVDELYQYLFWDAEEQGLKKDIHKAYTSFMIKVFIITRTEEILTSITHLPAYSDYTWLKDINADGAEELEIDKVYVVYE